MHVLNCLLRSASCKHVSDISICSGSSADFEKVNVYWDMTYSLIIRNMLIIVETCLLHLQMRRVDFFSKFSQKCGRVDLSHKKGEIVKIRGMKIVALKIMEYNLFSHYLTLSNIIFVWV